ncbi:MAG: DoxX family protein [Gemmatimonadota bacterium]
MPTPLSYWTMPILRAGMGVFLALWGLDKVLATEGSQRIFSGFYSIDSGPTLVQAAGIAEILLGVALAVGLLRVITAWVALIANLISTAASWRQIVDPWGVFGLTEGGTHLFLASIVIMAVSVVLVLNARDDSATVDRRLGITPRRRSVQPSPDSEEAALS